MVMALATSHSVAWRAVSACRAVSVVAHESLQFWDGRNAPVEDQRRSQCRTPRSRRRDSRPLARSWRRVGVRMDEKLAGGGWMLVLQCAKMGLGIWVLLEDVELSSGLSRRRRLKAAGGATSLARGRRRRELWPKLPPSWRAPAANCSSTASPLATYTTRSHPRPHPSPAPAHHGFARP